MSGADPQAIRNRVLKKVNAQKNNWYKVKSWQPKQSENKNNEINEKNDEKIEEAKTQKEKEQVFMLALFVYS